MCVVRTISKYNQLESYIEFIILYPPILIYEGKKFPETMIHLLSSSHQSGKSPLGIYRLSNVSVDEQIFFSVYLNIVISMQDFE